METTMDTTMDTTKICMVKYGELALRGKNRRIFQKQLAKQLKRRLLQIEGYQLTYEEGRYIIEPADPRQKEIDLARVLDCVRPTLGIVGFAMCHRTHSFDVDHIIKLAVEHLGESYGQVPFSFKADTRRINKSFPTRSYDLSAAIGEAVLKAFPSARVDVHKPDVVLRVEIRQRVYIYSKSVPGLGGLPAGSCGKGMLMLSGGIDSPVAGFVMAKRGLALEAVYFDSPPFTSDRALQKVQDLAQTLALYTGYVKLYVVQFTEVQSYLYESVPHEKLTIFMKRAMLKIATQLAHKALAQCVVTGDSLGQVASQTAEALAAIDAGANITILRPLAGHDKQEIIAIAQKIGTYQISIRPYEDCCTVFVPKHPEIRPKAHIIERMESKLTHLLQKTQEATDTAVVHEFF